MNLSASFVESEAKNGIENLFRDCNFVKAIKVSKSWFQYFFSKNSRSVTCFFNSPREYC
mgnify:CR=1 FL=1